MIVEQQGCVMYLNVVAAEMPRPSFERPLDLVHLARQTLGDRELEREILDLFVVQVKSMQEQMRALAAGQRRLDLAHTLKGSARAVGAWRVAQAAEACELVMNDGADWQDCLAALASSVSAVLAAIADFDRTH